MCESKCNVGLCSPHAVSRQTESRFSPLTKTLRVCFVTHYYPPAESIAICYICKQCNHYYILLCSKNQYSKHQATLQITQIYQQWATIQDHLKQFYCLFFIKNVEQTYHGGLTHHLCWVHICCFSSYLCDTNVIPLSVCVETPGHGLQTRQWRRGSVSFWAESYSSSSSYSCSPAQQECSTAGLLLQNHCLPLCTKTNT